MANEDLPEVDEVNLIEPTKEIHPVHFMPNHGEPVAAQKGSLDFRPTAHVFRNDDDEVVDVRTEDGHGNMVSPRHRRPPVHPSQAKFGQKELALDEQPTLTEQVEEEAPMTPPPPPQPPEPPQSPAAPPNDGPEETKQSPSIAAPKQVQQSDE